jgi:hypothetical protein
MTMTNEIFYFLAAVCAVAGGFVGATLARVI